MNGMNPQVYVCGEGDTINSVSETVFGRGIVTRMAAAHSIDPTQPLREGTRVIVSPRLFHSAPHLDSTHHARQPGGAAPVDASGGCASSTASSSMPAATNTTNTPPSSFSSSSAAAPQAGRPDIRTASEYAADSTDAEAEAWDEAMSNEAAANQTANAASHHPPPSSSSSSSHSMSFSFGPPPPLGVPDFGAGGAGFMDIARQFSEQIARQHAEQHAQGHGHNPGSGGPVGPHAHVNFGVFPIPFPGQQFPGPANNGQGGANAAFPRGFMPDFGQMFAEGGPLNGFIQTMHNVMAGAMPNQNFSVPPAREDIISRLEHFEMEDASKECNVCLDTYASDRSAVKLPCGHVFHRSCIETWLAESGICPVCRQPLSSYNQPT
jgi:hypothetical protein